MTRVPIRFDRPLPDGVYIGLPATSYFGQDALGSSDLVALWLRKWGWWWSSKHNPDWKQPTTKALAFGDALHALLGEGVAEYESRFAVEPDPTDYGDALVDKIEDMMGALKDAGFDVAGRSSWKKADWARAMRLNLPDVPCWPNLYADFEERSPGRAPISAFEDRMARLMREIALGPARNDNVDLRALFADVEHPPLAEVSIFWTEPSGIRFRARIDRMFPGFDLDLKTLGNWRGRPLDYVTGDEIAKRAMDVQRAHYWMARRLAMTMVAEGQLYGGSPEQRRWLESWPVEHREWDWVWLFYQKPERTGRAPVIFPVRDHSWVPIASGERRMSNLLRWGLAKRQVALDFYIKTVAEFGLDQPWARVEDVHYTEEGYQPRISLPEWIGISEPAEAGDYGEERDG